MDQDFLSEENNRFDSHNHEYILIRTTYFYTAFLRSYFYMDDLDNTV